MKNSPLEKLEMNKKKYNELVNQLEDMINNTDELDLESLEYLEGELAFIEKVVNSIKETTQKIAKMIHLQLIKRDKKINAKIKDKSSVEFNTVLSHKGKPARAIKRLESEAKKGDVDAQFFIGKTYLNGFVGKHGEIIMKDVGLGLKWLTLAFKNGNVEAGYLIGVFEKSLLNIDRAIVVFEKLAKDNHLKSINELAIIYKNDPKHKSYEKHLDMVEKLSYLE